MGKRKTSGKTDAQKIVDFISHRYAKWQGLVLEDKYWNNPNFSKWYVRQIMAANSLLRIYVYDDIINALKNKDNQWMSSLKCKGLIDDIKKEKFNREKVEKTKKVTIKKDIEEEYVPAKKKNKLDRLR